MVCTKTSKCNHFVYSLEEEHDITLSSHERGRLFHSYLPLDKCVTIHLNKLESPSPKKFDWNWVSGFEKKILKCCQCTFTISLLSPIREGCTLHVNKFHSGHPQTLCDKFGWNWPWGSGEVENLKSFQWRQKTTDRFWSEKLTWALDSVKLKI